MLPGFQEILKTAGGSREALPRLWPAPSLFLAKACARQESCSSPQGEFSPDSRMSLNVKQRAALTAPPPASGRGAG